MVPTKQLGLDKSTLSRTIDGLVNIGLVQRVTHLTDRRYNRLSLTLKGQEVADRINQANDGFYGRVFRDIGKANLDDVIDNFERLVTVIRNLQDRKK